jgi:predicted acyl esterase
VAGAGYSARTAVLDAATRSLARVLPQAESHTRCKPEDQATFEIVFERDIDLAGHMEARLWLEAEAGEDVDLFVAVEKRDRSGEMIGFPFSSAWEGVPVALGWLRASHRELDLDRSGPGQPWHRHTRRRPLRPGQPVCVRVEIWPSGTRFNAGERLRLILSGTDIHAPLHKHTDLRNKAPAS